MVDSNPNPAGSRPNVVALPIETNGRFVPGYAGPGTPPLPGTPPVRVAPALPGTASVQSPGIMYDMRGSPVPDIHTLVVRQIEWYLGKQNLSRDFYLKNRMNPDFWAPLEVLLQFPKMKKLGVLEIAQVAKLLRERSREVMVDDLGLFVRPLWAIPFIQKSPKTSQNGDSADPPARSVLILTGIPSTVEPAVVTQSLKEIEDCPVPTLAQPEGEKSYSLVFGSADGAKKTLELAAGKMVAGTYPIKGHIRPEPVAPSNPPAPNMLPLPASPRSPYSPHMMISPMPIQSPYTFAMPPATYGQYMPASRGFYTNGVYPAMFGIDQGLPAGAAMPGNGASPGPVMSAPSTPGANAVPISNGIPMTNRGMKGAMDSHLMYSKQHAPQNVAHPHDHGNHINRNASGNTTNTPHARNAGGRNARASRRSVNNMNANIATDSTTQTTQGGPALNAPGNGVSAEVSKSGGAQKVGGPKGLRPEKGSGVAGSGHMAESHNSGRSRGGHGSSNSNGERKRNRNKRRNHNKGDDGKLVEGRAEARNEDSSKKLPDRKKKDAEISTMYFPPLPGSNDAAAGVMTAVAPKASSYGGPSVTSPRPKSTDGTVYARREATSKQVADSSNPVLNATPKSPVEVKKTESQGNLEEAAKASHTRVRDEEPRRRDSAPSGLSYAAILLAKGRTAASPGATNTTSGTSSPRSVTHPNAARMKEEASAIAARHVADLSSAVSSVTSPDDSSSSENRSVQEYSTEDLVSNPVKQDEEEKVVVSPREKSGSSNSVKSDSTGDSSTAKRSTSTSTSTPIGCTTATSEVSKNSVKESKQQVESTDKISPSNSVWANKPRSVYEASPAGHTPRPAGAKIQRSMGKTPGKTPTAPTRMAKVDSPAEKEAQPRLSRGKAGRSGDARGSGGTSRKEDKSSTSSTANGSHRVWKAVTPKSVWGVKSPKTWPVEQGSGAISNKTATTASTSTSSGLDGQ